MPFDAEITEKSRALIVLERARKRIARGWCQHQRISNSGVCIVGALQLAAGLNPNHCNIYEETSRWTAIMGFGPHGPTCADTWNDAERRTQAEVLARFDAAIARLSA